MALCSTLHHVWLFSVWSGLPRLGLQVAEQDHPDLSSEADRTSEPVLVLQSSFHEGRYQPTYPNGRPLVYCYPLQERDKLGVSRTCVNELVQGIKFKASLPEDNYMTIVKVRHESEYHSKVCYGLPFPYSSSCKTLENTWTLRSIR